jgi:hypothetical protein
MGAARNQGVYFIDGCLGRRHVVGIVAGLIQHDDAVEFTRFYTYNHDTATWLHTNWEHAIVSVAYTRVGADWTWHLLSKRGVLIQGTAAGVRTLTIPDAGTGPGRLGYVNQVRIIDRDLYVCGFRRQVYRLEGASWVKLHQGILADSAEHTFGFQSIDGTSANDLYAVGFKGELFHYDGRAWQKIELPTAVDLNRVRCVAPNLIYACGDAGVVVHGDGTAWQVVSDPAMSRDLWGLEVVDGTVFLAALDGLYRLDGSRVVAIETGLQPPPTGYRLTAHDGLLWSVGHRDLAFFDGSKWERVICPDNAVP